MLSGGKLVAIILVALLGVGIAFLPTKGAEPTAEETVTEASGLDAKIEEAVAIITEGKGAPMKGIQLLKEVLEEDSTNTKALYYLGSFSIQSGQFDKAITRFESLLRNDPENEEAKYLLGYSRVMFGDTVSGIQILEELARKGSSAEYRELAQEEISKLKNL